jgi:hypothetical protein
MAWRVKSSPKAAKVTAKMAKEWAEMDTVQMDRTLSERRLGVYRRLLMRGEFRPVTWAKVWCKETGQEYRVNGKHTSTLLASVDLKTVPDQQVIIETYEADSLEDVARLYSTFDSRQQTRTVGDINRSFASTIPELADLNDVQINLAVSALAFNLWPTTEGGWAGKGKTAAERAELMFDNVDSILWINSLIQKNPDCRHMWRVPVAAAMIGTYLKNKQGATQFWTAVRDETGANPDLPDRKLARWLLTMRVRVSAGATEGKRWRAEPREFYVRCIHAWNAWRQNKPTDLKYYSESDIPTIS